MRAEDFCRWLRGYFEIAGETALTKEQTTIISQHLALVFEEKAKTLPPISKRELEKRRQEMLDAASRIQLEDIFCSSVGPSICSPVACDTHKVDPFENEDPLAFIQPPTTASC